MLTLTPADRTLASELGLFLICQPLMNEDHLAAQRPGAIRKPEIWLVRCALTKRPIGRLLFTEVDHLYVTKHAANMSQLEETVAGALRWIAPLIRHVRTGLYAGTEIIVPRFRSMHVRPRLLTECGARSTSADYDPTEAQSELINGQSHEMCPACRAKLEERGVPELPGLPAGSSASTPRQQNYIHRLLEEGTRSGRAHLMEEQSIHQLSGREASMMIDRLKSLKERHWKGELWTTPTIQRNRTSSSEGSFAVASAAECGQKKPVPCAERTLAIPCTLKIHGKLPTSQDMPQNTMNQIHVHGFRLQSTASFQEGAPQRENYITDHSFESACASYAKEWRQAYRCAGCRNRECPQCGEQEP